VQGIAEGFRAVDIMLSVQQREEGFGANSAKQCEIVNFNANGSNGFESTITDTAIRWPCCSVP
jgi:hypothetical protein